MISKIREPVSALTHLLGALIAIPITVLLIVRAARMGSALHVVSYAIFGAALILLYSASFTYHCLSVPDKVSKMLRRVDHMMIYVLIAGTYTPVCLVLLRGGWGYTLLVLVWAFAAIGIVLKLFWLDAPRYLSTAMYVAMGWLVLIAFLPLVRVVSTVEMTLLVLGGVTYTLGAVIYAVKWPPLRSKVFGFHEIFHIFVLGGSAFHVALMFCL